MAIELVDPNKSIADEILKNLQTMEEGAGPSRAPAGTISIPKLLESEKEIGRVFDTATKKAETYRASQQKEIYKDLIGTQKDRKKAAELQAKAIAGNLQSPQTVRGALDFLDSLEAKIQSEAAGTKKGVAEKYESAIKELEKSKNQEMSTGEIFARSIIALAPALIGRAAGGMVGGVAGGEAGVKGLETLDKVLKEQRDAAQKAAQLRVETIGKIGKEELEQAAKMQEKVLGGKIDLSLLPLKQDYAARLQGLRQSDPLAYAKLALDIEKLGLQIEQLSQKAELGKAQGILKGAEVPAPKGAKTEAEKGGADLSYGFKMKGTDWTPKQRDLAAKRVSALRSFNASVDDLSDAITKAGIKGATKWTESGKEVSQKFANFLEAVRTYREAGASFTGSEMKLGKESGFDLQGDPKDALRLAFDPLAAKKFLASLKTSQVKKTVEQLAPYNVEYTQAAAKTVSSLGSPENLKKVFDGMSNEEKINFKNASPAQRVEILKKKMGQ